MSDLSPRMDDENVQQNCCQNADGDSDYASNSSPATTIVTYNDRFPYDVLKWIKFNASPRQSLKLMKICKFFQHRNFPYFVVEKIENNGDRWEYWSLDGEKHSLENNEDLPNNLWIVKEIRLYREFNFTALFQKIVVCDAKYLYFHDCSPTISYNEFKYLTASGNVEDLAICGSVIRYEENGEAVPFEEILECLPKIIAITLSDDFPPIHSLEAAKNAVAKTFKYFEFTSNDIEMLHFNTFSKFIIQNQQIEYFCSSEYTPADENPPKIFSEKYIQEIRDYVDDIIIRWKLEFSPPIINFTEQIKESYDAMNQLHHLHYIRRQMLQFLKSSLNP